MRDRARICHKDDGGRLDPVCDRYYTSGQLWRLLRQFQEEKAMKIGELARYANCRPMTIRYYEKIGLMPNLRRTDSNYRLYGPEDMERLRFIIHCRNQQLPLHDIQTLLEMKDNGGSCEAGIIDIVKRHAERVKGQIAALGVIAGRLDELLADKGSRGHAAHLGRRLLDILSAPCPECPDYDDDGSRSCHLDLGKVSPQ